MQCFCRAVLQGNNTKLLSLKQTCPYHRLIKAIEEIHQLKVTIGMEFLEHHSELRSQIDNRAFISVQTASGGGVFISVNSLIEVVELAPQLYHDFVIFIALNAFSFLISLVGILIRRETNRLFSQAKTVSNLNITEDQKAMALRRAWRWSNIMWLAIAISILVLIAAYAVLIYGLYNTELKLK
jgi:hypothetical protein